jgi:leucyl aminopeptidase
MAKTQLIQSTIVGVSGELAKLSATALVVPVWSGEALSGSAATVDQATAGLVSKLLETKEFNAKLYETLSIHQPAGLNTRLLLLVGCGEQAKWDAGRAFRVAGAAAKALAGKSRPDWLFAMADILVGDQWPAAIAGATVGMSGQDLYKADKKLHAPKTISWLGVSDGALLAGKILAESMALTRSLVNEPADVIYPETFVERALPFAKELGLEVEVWDQRRLEQERCGSLLAVAKGSSREPRLLQLHYHGGPVNGPRLALVGKGVTFDSGGLSLKTPDNMLTMKCDMAGAATVLGAMVAIARLKLPVNVSMYAGLVENMTGPAAMKLGDVLNARSGKTIEVHNTDAEGRLVLADVLDVAREKGCDYLVDLATLTGACVVALGTDVAGAMSNNPGWLEQVLDAATKSGEPLWPLPMFPEFDEDIAGSVADIKNVGNGRWGGAITAAKFLEAFVGTTPWVHLDIAGPAFYDKAKPWSDAGASGMFVRTLVQLAGELK